MRIFGMLAWFALTALTVAVTGTPVTAQSKMQPFVEANGLFSISLPDGWSIDPQVARDPIPGFGKIRTYMSAAAPEGGGL